MQHEMPCADPGLSVEKQILRTAEGRQQASPDGGDILHGDHKQDVFFLASAAEEPDGQRNEDDQGDVVRDEHGTEEDPEDQKQRQVRHPF